MIGLVLWYNPEPGVGVVWCEDQGPLAFLGPEVAFPDGDRALDCGDQLFLDVETRDGVRYVSRVRTVTPCDGGTSPGEILAEHHRASAAEPELRVVA